MLAEQVGRIRMACDEVDHLDGLCGNAQQRVQVRMRAAALVQQQLAQRAAVEAAGPTDHEKGQNVIHTYINTNIYYWIYIIYTVYILYIIHAYIHTSYIQTRRHTVIYTVRMYIYTLCIQKLDSIIYTYTHTYIRTYLHSILYIRNSTFSQSVHAS